MSTALPPLPSITEILLGKEQGPLTMEQLWSLKFHIMRINPIAHSSMFDNVVRSVIRHFVVAAHKGNVRRAIDLKDMIVWMIDYTKDHRNINVAPMRVHWADVAGFVVGDGLLNTPSLFEAIVTLTEKDVYFADTGIGAMSTDLRKFYDI